MEWRSIFKAQHSRAQSRAKCTLSLLSLPALFVLVRERSTRIICIRKYLMCDGIHIHNLHNNRSLARWSEIDMSLVCVCASPNSCSSASIKCSPTQSAGKTQSEASLFYTFSTRILRFRISFGVFTGHHRSPSRINSAAHVRRVAFLIEGGSSALKFA